MARQKGQAKVEKDAVALKTLKVEYVGLDEIKPNSYNPNRQSDHDFQLLLKSMSEDGFTQPIVVHSDTREIVDGEHRWRAAHELGLDKIPVVFVDMTEAQMRIATLRHNRARGSEDVNLGAEVLKDLQQLGALEWAQDSLQLDDVELDRLLNDVSVTEGLAADDFNDAWEPAPLVSDDNEGERGGSIGQATSQTPGAATALREQEKRIADARTEEEKQAAQRDRTTYRVALLFSAEEADIVKQVLERDGSPASTLLEICTEIVGNG